LERRGLGLEVSKAADICDVESSWQDWVWLMSAKQEGDAKRRTTGRIGGEDSGGEMHQGKVL